jgi:hypothetical protein
MGPVAEQLAGQLEQINKRVGSQIAGPLQEAVARQARIGEMLNSSVLNAVRSIDWPEINTRQLDQVQAPVLDTSLLDDLAAREGERRVRQDKAAVAAVQTVDAIQELVSVSRAQHDQFGAVTAALFVLADQGKAAALDGKRQFRWGVVVGAATLIVAAATLWVTILVWQTAT